MTLSQAYSGQNGAVQRLVSLAGAERDSAITESVRPLGRKEARRTDQKRREAAPNIPAAPGPRSA